MKNVIGDRALRFHMAQEVFQSPFLGLQQNFFFLNPQIKFVSDLRYIKQIKTELT